MSAMLPPGHVAALQRCEFYVLPDLQAALAHLQRMAEALTRLEWAGEHAEYYTRDRAEQWSPTCPDCSGLRDNGGHEPKCGLAAVLAEYARWGQPEGGAG